MLLVENQGSVEGNWTIKGGWWIGSSHFLNVCMWGLCGVCRCMWVFVFVFVFCLFCCCCLFVCFFFACFVFVSFTLTEHKQRHLVDTFWYLKTSKVHSKINIHMNKTQIQNYTCRYVLEKDHNNQWGIDKIIPHFTPW